MTNPVTLIRAIQSNLVPIRNALGSENAAKFEEDYHQLVELAQDVPDSPQILEQLQELITNYPDAAQVLSQNAPGLFDAPHDPSPPASRGVTDRASATNNVPSTAQLRTGDPAGDGAGTHGIQGQIRRTHDPEASLQDTEPSSSILPPDVPNESVTNAAKHKRLTRTTETTDTLSRWTPELVIQLIKEIVAALMGLFLIGFTLYIANRTFAFAGDAKRLPDAKDLLLLLLGLAGVVLGYYFGRVPADARAAQAQKQATDATTHAERVSVRADQIAQQIDTVLTRAATTRSGGNIVLDVTTTEELQRLRNELRGLTRFGV